MQSTKTNEINVVAIGAYRAAFIPGKGKHKRIPFRAKYTSWKIRPPLEEKRTRQEMIIIAQNP